MKIIGFNFTKIQAERKKPAKGELKIDTNLKIDNIEKETIDIAGDILKFSYSYEIKYNPEFAEVFFKGEILIVPDNIKQVMKDWKKKMIKDEIRIPLFNYIMAKCNLKALQIEEDLGLPVHIPMPRFSQQPAQKSGSANYAG